MRYNHTGYDLHPLLQVLSFYIGVCLHHEFFADVPFESIYFKIQFGANIYTTVATRQDQCYH